MIHINRPIFALLALAGFFFLAGYSKPQPDYTTAQVLELHRLQNAAMHGWEPTPEKRKQLIELFGKE